MVVIELKDDGGGLDPKRIHAKAVERGLLNEDASLSDGEIFNLIFEPGFSTVEKVTQVSGRGVGMDVVKQEIDSLNGRIDIKSEIGVGTTFAVHFSHALAITEGMLVRVGEQRYILPTSSIVACFRPDGEQLSTAANHGEIVRVRGECAPVFRLHHIFNLMDGERDPTHGLLLLIGAVGTTYALLVDEVLGQYQVVTKSLGKGVGKVEGVSGGAILGDGQVGLILDPAGISVKAKRLGPAPDMAA